MANIDTKDVTKTDKTDKCPKDEDIDLAVEGLKHLNLGKRHLLVEDYSSAVQDLQEACQLLDQRYGIGAEECGEAYLYYGSALLELARREDGLFDGTVQTKLEEMSPSEDEQESDDEEENEGPDEPAKDENQQNDKKTDTEEDIENSDEEKRKKLNEKQNDVSVVMQSSASADMSADISDMCVASTSKGITSDDNELNTKNGDETEDEASNIEVAFEVLTLAKHVFTRFIDKNDNKIKLTEALQALGEISIEWENNSNAIEILNECLTLRKEVLSEDDRMIAETYYQLGIANSFNNDIQNANNCFQNAIQVIESRIENQKKILSTLKEEDIDSVEKIKRELKQLESLLPEMKVKIEDSNDQMVTAKQGLELEENERKEEEAIALKNKEIKEKPINNISHLIKRKY
ncbi:protein HGV2-like isoform X2 [Oppia nitens]|uniref:protein HGV2-like isoform X2 n=1 Tax=Oppia nitens TaxID=1686743 RepID=UPI0023DC5CE0|nr:protein HGV2-like isoform X2 [Oppia nitens]